MKKLTAQGIIDALVSAAIRAIAEKVIDDLERSGRLTGLPLKTEVAAPVSHEQKGEG